MGSIGATLELGVCLSRDPIWMVGQFDELDQPPVRGNATADQAGLLEARPILRIELEAVSMAFADDGFAIGRVHSRAWREDGVIGAESHRAAFVRHLSLVVHEIDDRVTSGWLKLRRVRLCEAGHITGELDRHGVQAEAETETRNRMFPCITRRGDLALEAAGSEPSRDHQTVEVGQAVLSEQALDVLGLNPFDVDPRPMMKAGVFEAFDNGEVRIGQLDVFADQADAHWTCRRFNGLHERSPRSEVDLVGLEAQHLQGHGVEALVVEDQGEFIDIPGIGGIHHRLLIDIAEIGDLPFQLLAERCFASTHDDVGLNPSAPKFSDRVLGRLCLLLTGWTDERHQGDVHVTHVVPAGIFAELSDRFEKWKDLDVTDGAADLGDDDIDIIGRDPLYPALDLVGDVWDDLHGLAEIVATSFCCEDGLVDRACRGIRATGETLIDESLVVAEIEVSLTTIIGDEDLTVLIWVHRARVDIDVRIELLHRDPQATHLEQATQ